MFSATNRLHAMLASLLFLALSIANAAVLPSTYTNDSDGSLLRPKQHDAQNLSPGLSLSEEDRLLVQRNQDNSARILQANVVYQFDVKATYNIGVAVLGPKAEEVEDMIRLTQIHFIRHIGSEYGQAFQAVTCDDLFLTSKTEFTITVNFLATLSFYLAAGLPTQEAARIRMETFDQDLYISNFVSLAKPEENFVYAESLAEFIVTSRMPTPNPTTTPSSSPSSATPAPSRTPSAAPSLMPSVSLSAAPSSVPSVSPSAAPSGTPSASPSNNPSAAPSSVPSIAPTATSAYDITDVYAGTGCNPTSGFCNCVPETDPNCVPGPIRRIISPGLDRLQRVVIGDLPDVTGFGSFLTDCGFAPNVIDDLFLCISSGNLADGVIGLATPRFSRTDSRLPFLAEITFNLDLLNENSELLLQLSVEHLTLHSLGIGRLWDDDFFDLVNTPSTTCTYKSDTLAGAAFREITGCPEGTDIPLEQVIDAGDVFGRTTCTHWSDDCFGEQLLMNTKPTVNSVFDKITVASLADLGYTVNDRETDDISDENFSAECRCDGSPLESAQYHYKIPLSEKGEAKAIAAGLAAIEKNRLSSDAALASVQESNPGVIFEGDKYAYVLVMERGVLHGVAVEAP